MPYTPDPTNATQPLDSEAAGTAAAEFRALKGRVNALANAKLLWNRVQNGNFVISQRYGASSITLACANPPNDLRTLDRWLVRPSGTGNITAQQITAADGVTKLLRITGGAGSGQISVIHRIEAVDCIDLANSTISLGVDISNSLLTTVSWAIFRPNTIDTYPLYGGGRTTLASGTFTVTGTLTRYTTQVSLPVSATTGLEIVFSVIGQTSGTFDLGNVQLEPGTVATPFATRSIAQELILCSRYSQVLSNITSITYAPSASSTIKVSLPFRVPLRISPATWTTLALSATNASGNYISDVGNQGAAWAVVAAAAGMCGITGGQVEFNADL